MARIFYEVVDGDPITSGGYLVVPPHGDTVSDDDGRERYLAYIGHRAWCERCKTMGTIIGGSGISDHMRMSNGALGGMRQAVSGDYVACGCETHPTIVARYARRFTITDGGATGAAHESGAGAWVDRSASSVYPHNDTRKYDEQVRATDTGATNGYPYFIETADGRTKSGRLDGQALLSRIATVEADDYVIYWGDEALAKQYGV